jgi:hypothetical protein
MKQRSVAYQIDNAFSYIARHQDFSSNRLSTNKQGMVAAG